MIIRKLNIYDKKQLFELIEIIENSIERPDFWLPINDISREHFFNSEWTEFYGAFDNKRLVAASALFYNEHEYRESVNVLHKSFTSIAEIGRSMVIPEYRGNNVLYSINTKLVSIAHNKKIEYLLATIHPENIPSRKSFLKLGMARQTTYTKSCGYIRDIFLMKV